MSDTPPAPAPSALRRLAPWSGLILGGVALAVAVTGQLGFDGRVRAYLLANPGVLQEMLQAQQTQASQAGVEETVRRVSADPSLIAPDPRDPAFGPENAVVTVIEYFDFQCPGCKAVAPDYVRLMQAHPDVRFVFKDWAILDRGAEGTSNYAARAALAAHRQGLYMPVYQALLAEPALEPAAIDQILVENGVDLARAKTDMDSAEVRDHVADIDANAQGLALQGTPTFLVNGRPTESIEPAAVAQAIEAAKAG